MIDCPICGREVNFSEYSFAEECCYLCVQKLGEEEETDNERDE